MNTLRKTTIVRATVMLVLVALLVAVTTMLSAASNAVAQGERPEKPLHGQLAAAEIGESATGFPAWINDENEPNNTRATAEDYSKCGQGVYFNCVLGGKIGSNNDVDYWSFKLEDFDYSDHFAVLFDIEAQSIGSALDPVICLYADDGTELACNDDTDTVDSMLFYNVEAGRTYYLRVTDYYDVGGSDYNYQIIATTPLLISAQTRGKVGGISFNSGDILAWSSDIGSLWDSRANPTWEKWVLFFDLSDLGVNANLTNLAAGWRNSDYLLLGFQAKMNLPGITGKVTPQDVIVFNPSKIGPATEGEFQLWWVGANYGLSTSNERIDAIDWPNWSGDTRLYVSTSGTASVPTGWPGSRPGVLKDEDIGMAMTSSNTWDRFFDGNRLEGLGIEDVVAMDVADYSPNSFDYLLLVIQGTGRVGDNGLKVTQKDIFRTTSNPWLSWFWDADMFWHGPDHGWRYNIDAIEYPQLDKDCLGC